jgi:Protein of unknown function (DUF3788)
MEIQNAFVGKKEQPLPEEVAAALGPTTPLWIELIDWMATVAGVSTQEWSGIYAHKYGWNLKLKVKKRTIVYMGPCKGYFKVSFVLSDRAMVQAKGTEFSKKVQQALAEAPRYPEGYGLRVAVMKVADLAPVRKLAEIKLAS